MTTRVRRAEPADAAALAAVHVRSWQVGYAHLAPPGFLDRLDVAARTERWTRILGRRVPPSETFVAEVEGVIAGFVSVGPYRSEDEPAPDGAGEVYAIYVDPPRWASGVGSALMTRALAYLTGTGRSDVRLWVFDDNPRARGFYERHGFRPDGSSTTYRFPGTDGDGVPEIRYARMLGPAPV